MVDFWKEPKEKKVNKKKIIITTIIGIIIILLIYLATSFWEVYNSSDGNRKSKYIILCLKWLLLFVVCGVFIILNAAC